MNTHRLVRTLLLSGAALLLCPMEPVRAYGLLGPTWATYTTVPVYLDQALPALLIHNDGTQWTQSELEAEIRFELHLIAQSSEANLPYVYYAGLRPTPCAGGIDCRKDDDIVITSNVTPGPGNCKDYTAYSTNPPHDGRVIAMRSTASPACSPSPTWEHLWTGTGWPINWMLMHELGHAIGLDHSSIPGCYSAPCAIMDSGGGSGWDPFNDWYYADDRDGLRAAYGPASLGMRVHEESNDGASWWTLSTPPTTGTNFSVSSAPTGSPARMFEVYHDPSDGSVRARTWEWVSMYWQNRTSPTVTWAPGPAGAAFPAVSLLASQSYLRNETTTNVAKDWGFVRHTADFSTFSIYQSSVPPLTRRHGISAAFDPKTNSTVQVWRTTEMELRIQVVDSAGNFVSAWPVVDGAGAHVQSFGPPSVACGDSSIAENCVIAWSFATPPGSADDFHTLRWMHFHMDHFLGFWSHAQAPIMAAPFIMQGPPLVAYKGSSTSSSAFMFAGYLDYGGSHYVWTMRKGADATSTPITMTFHGSFVGRRFYSALGAAGSDVELIYARRP